MLGRLPVLAGPLTSAPPANGQFTLFAFAVLLLLSRATGAGLPPHDVYSVQISGCSRSCRLWMGGFANRASARADDGKCWQRLGLGQPGAAPHERKYRL